MGRLLLINQEMYRTVSPILYHTPIVQNLGLFLLGIDQTPRPDDDDVVPYHKSRLLDKVQKLHLIHASSRKGVERQYMTAPCTETEPDPFSFSEESLKTCDADKLGMADVEGWLLAERILKVTPIARPMFNKLKAFSFGVWDTGRWDDYHNSLGDNAPIGLIGHNINVFPWDYLERILADLILRSRAANSLDVCSSWREGTNVQLRHYSDKGATGPGLQVTHGASGGHVVTHVGPTRAFARPIPQWILDSESHADYLSHSFRSYLQTAFSPDNEETWAGTRLELCIIAPYDEDLSTTVYDHRLSLAERTKEALELCHQDLAKTEEWAKKALGKIRIYTGDEIPACPCCGTKE
jgi:hypothetical protein